MSETTPTILWLRRDLRLSDHPSLTAAIDRGGPVIPVYIHDKSVEDLGAAPKWRLGLAIDHLAKALEDKGSRLILRKGDAHDVLEKLMQETGATAIYWTRLYDPQAIDRDRKIKAAFRDTDVEAKSFDGHVMFEPWTVETKTGGYYKVYSPLWKAVKGRDVASPLKTPGRIPAPESWPNSEKLEDWQMGRAMNRGADICLPYQRVGEARAQERLHWFVDEAIGAYDSDRDIPGMDGTSGLSENLTYGEISPRQCWHAGRRALEEGRKGAEAWLKELVWREFAYHLVYHSPQIITRNWREGWDSFPWETEEDRPSVLKWKQGRTGVEFVDAAMREMYVTGKMHNRARMIVGSYLTKHMMTHWKIGLRWFEECLTDWDPASNAMGWQWVAGCGPDAAPYFRIFNPETQVEKFDKDRSYRRKWIAEGQGNPPKTALDFFEAVPRSWDLSPSARYPSEPIVDMKEGRALALDAYENRDF
jgi:deoxyribodipyrimidine photo-lyase